jgi:hypothetical protein
VRLDLKLKALYIPMVQFEPAYSSSLHVRILIRYGPRALNRLLRSAALSYGGKPAIGLTPSGVRMDGSASTATQRCYRQLPLPRAHKHYQTHSLGQDVRVLSQGGQGAAQQLETPMVLLHQLQNVRDMTVEVREEGNVHSSSGSCTV